MEITLKCTEENYAYRYYFILFSSIFTTTELRILAELSKYNEIDTKARKLTRESLGKSQYQVNNAIKKFKDKGVMEGKPLKLKYPLTKNATFKLQIK